MEEKSGPAVHEKGLAETKTGGTTARPSPSCVEKVVQVRRGRDGVSSADTTCGIQGPGVNRAEKYKRLRGSDNEGLWPVAPGHDPICLELVTQVSVVVGLPKAGGS